MQFQTLQSFSSLQCIKDYFALGIFKLFAQISEIATWFPFGQKSSFVYFFSQNPGVEKKEVLGLEPLIVSAK
jgi:hypothetical protein